MNAGQIQTTRMGSWDLVAKPSPITRGSQSNFHCGLPGFGPSLSKSREMRRVGCEGIQAKIPLAICNQPLQISQSYFLSCKIMNQPEYCKKKYLPCYKYEKYLRSRANADFTQSIFSFPRREGDCVWYWTKGHWISISGLTSSGCWQMPLCSTCSAPRWLVYINRPEGPIFSHLIYPLHIKFLQLVIQGKTHEYLVLPFVSLSPWVFVKCT